MVKVRLCERQQLTPLVSGHPGVISAVSIRVGTQFRYYGLVSGVLKCVPKCSVSEVSLQVKKVRESPSLQAAAAGALALGSSWTNSCSEY